MGVASDNLVEINQQAPTSLSARDPGQNPDLDVTAFGEASEQQVRYYLYADVVEELIKAARYREESATAVLIGQFCLDEDGPFVEVTAFRDLQYLYGGDAVELTHPVLEKFFEEIADDDEQAEARHVVGAFVASPGQDGHLSAEAARLHLSLFNLPYQVVFVVDGVDEKLGLYARTQRGPFFNARFHLVETRQAKRAAAERLRQWETRDEFNVDKPKTEMETIDENDRDRGVGSAGDTRQPRKPDRGV